MENTLDWRAPSSGRTNRSGVRPLGPVCSGKPIGMSTAATLGPSPSENNSANDLIWRSAMVVKF